MLFSDLRIEGQPVYWVSRFLQLAGLVVVPLAVLGNVADPQRVTLKDSLVMSAIGMGVFFAGWLMQRSSGS